MVHLCTNMFFRQEKVKSSLWYEFWTATKHHQSYSLQLDCSKKMSFKSLFLHLENLFWCGIAWSTDPDTVAFRTLCTSTQIFLLCNAGSAFVAPSDSTLPWEGLVPLLKGGRQERWTSFLGLCWRLSNVAYSGQWIAAWIWWVKWCSSCVGSPNFPTVTPKPTQYFCGKWTENIPVEEEQVHGLPCTEAMN